MSFVKRNYTAHETPITAENLNAMQDELIRLNDDKYDMPVGGIPKSDLAAAVQTSLGKADTALQQQSLTPYRTAAAQDEIDAAQNQVVSSMDTALKSGEQADAIYHLGFYIDENGDLCQVD